jgi:hypothetical protein
MAKRSRGKRDGENMAVYKGHEKWSHRRWAWEFLQRNDNFRKKCDAAESTNRRNRKEIALEFGLLNFKHYKEHYLDGDKPRFLLSTRIYRTAGTSKRYEITLRPTEIMLRFDLSYAAKDQKILRAQIRRAQRIIEKNVTEIRSSKSLKALTSRFKFSSKDLLLKIRVLDALIVDEKQQAEILDLIYPNLGRGKDNIEKRSTLRKRITHAKKLSTTYLEILASK